MSRGALPHTVDAWHPHRCQSHWATKPTTLTRHVGAYHCAGFVAAAKTMHVGACNDYSCRVDAAHRQDGGRCAAAAADDGGGGRGGCGAFQW